MMRKNSFAFVALMVVAILLQGCATYTYVPSYKDDQSEAYNIADAGGLYLGIKDRALSEAKTPYKGPGIGIGDMLTVASIGVGAFEGGVLGMSNLGSAAFNGAHGVWAASSDDYWSSNYFYGYIPLDYNQSLKSPMDVRAYVENKLIETSIAVLFDQGFKVNKLKTSEILNNKPVKRWALENSAYGCSFDKVNCLLTIYTVNENQIAHSINPGFLGDKRSVESWRFYLGTPEKKSTIDITSTGTKSIIPELDFYKKLSSSMPNWFNLYIAPNRASTPSHESGALPYNFVLNDGRFLEFIDPDS
ncbi:hypothetical protein [Endozoicomonas sp. ISHI1]|uniref:hypothetical protein n=1 Tax=Endozoicomonas sp. ISHI1 TaxID=2825882 RepID=UPI002149950A|nr:hypothetical protein [Endozoicomonas sp. ISHI1]